jgi:hypothetical protein
MLERSVGAGGRGSDLGHQRTSLSFHKNGDENAIVDFGRGRVPVHPAARDPAAVCGGTEIVVRLIIVAMAFASTAGLGSFGCSGGGGAGSSDTEGTDSDTGPACGGVDAECCTAAPVCDDDNAAVDCAAFASGCCCYGACTVALCQDAAADAGPSDTPCFDASGVGNLGLCWSEEDTIATDKCAGAATMDACTTPSGEVGICLMAADTGWAIDMCLRECAPAPNECDGVHYCAPLTDSSGAFAGGACTPTGT